MRTLLCLAMAPLFFTTAVCGQSDDPDNAALWYARAIHAHESIPGEVRTLIRTFDWANPHAAVTDELRLALARYKPILRMIRKGSRRAYSDFDLDYSRGWELVMSHLGHLNDISRLMRADAIVRLRDGDSATAAEELGTLFRLAGHVGEDRLVISSLVGTAIFHNADRVMQVGLDRASFTASDSSRMLSALEGLSSQDPFDFVGALENERTVMLDWMRDRYALTEDRARIVEDFTLEKDPPTMMAGLMMVDQSQFDAALDQADALMGRVIDVFSLDDPAEAQFELEQIGLEIQRGEHGPLAMILVPAYAKLCQRMHETEETIAKRTALLEAIVTGTVTPGELANAAVWYLRAVDMLNTIEPARLEQLRAVIDDPAEPLDKEPAKTLAAASTIVETLRVGSRKRRCDFSIARRYEPSAIPNYLPGLRTAARLLIADTVRLLQRHEADAAADRLAIGYRLSAHLAGDGIIASSLVSHTMFDANDMLAQWAIARDAFSDTQRSTLLKAVETMSRKDPFGYVASITSTREHVRKWIASSAPRIPGEDTPRARALVRGLDGDQLLYLHIVSTSPEDRGEPAQSDAIDSLRGLDEMISLENLTLARAQAPEVRRAVKSGAFEALSERVVPEIANVRQRLASARADLRLSVLALRTKPASQPAARR